MTKRSTIRAVGRRVALTAGWGAALGGAVCIALTTTFAIYGWGDDACPTSGRQVAGVFAGIVALATLVGLLAGVVWSIGVWKAPGDGAMGGEVRPKRTEMTWASIGVLTLAGLGLVALSLIVHPGPVGAWIADQGFDMSLSAAERVEPPSVARTDCLQPRAAGAITK